MLWVVILCLVSFAPDGAVSVVLVCCFVNQCSVPLIKLRTRTTLRFGPHLLPPTAVTEREWKILNSLRVVGTVDMG